MGDPRREYHSAVASALPPISENIRGEDSSSSGAASSSSLTARGRESSSPGRPSSPSRNRNRDSSFFHRQRSSTNSTVNSARTAGSARSSIWRPLQLVRSFSLARHASPGEFELNDSPARTEFLNALVMGQPRNGTLLEATRWMTNYLEHKFAENWSFVRGPLRGLDRQVELPNNGEVAVVYRLLTVMVKMLSTKSEMALSDLADEVTNKEILNDFRDDRDREKMYQFLFTLLGWLTMVYQPRENPKKDRLQLSKHAVKASGEKTEIPKQFLHTFSQDLQSADQQFHTLLARFGDLIPDGASQRRSSIVPDTEFIKVSSVCYHTLRQVCKIEILWVDTLSLHLEFDSSRKTLKLLRFPSFCRLLYRQGGRTFLSKLFEDNTSARDSSSSTSNSHYTPPTSASYPYHTYPTYDSSYNPPASSYRGGPNPTTLTPAFARELLLTYRILFGQDPSSHALFASEMSRLARSAPSPPPPMTTATPPCTPASPSGNNTFSPSPAAPGVPIIPDARTGSISIKETHMPIHLTPSSDPLLPTLCALPYTHPAPAALYADIRAGNTLPHYSPSEFPFFGRKLMELQGFVVRETADSWRAMWHDRKRNPGLWWGYWAVFFVGGITIILMAASLALQAWQVQLAQQQIDQGNSNNPSPSSSPS